MRQGQHNKRARGRGRKPQNVNRTFESNGPDVKIRGTAATIADKYLSLARDAQASGDPVASENYLQHAEHYFRIIAAAQAYAQSQQQQQSEQPQVMNGHQGETDSDGREPRQNAQSGANGGSPGDRPGQDARSDQQQDGGDDGGGESRGRRNRGRRGRRAANNDDSEVQADGNRGGDSDELDASGSTDGNVVAEVN